MLRKLGYVALTYCSPMTALCGLLLLIFLLNVTRIGSSDLMVMSNILLAVTFAVVMLVVTQAKWQFAHPRARLIPDFTAPHLGVVLLSLSLSLVVFPVGIAVRTGVNAIGIVAFLAAIAAPMAWGIHVGSNIWVFLVLGINFSVFIPGVEEFWFKSGAHVVPLHPAILLAASAWLGMSLWRIATLHEERSDYEFDSRTIYTRRSFAERADQRRVVAHVLAKSPIQSQVVDWWHDRIERLATFKPSRYVALLRYGFRAVPVECLAVGMTLMAIVPMCVVLLFPGYTGKQNSMDNVPNSGVVIMLSMPVLLLPAGMASESITARRPRMRAEILRPHTREQFYGRLITAAAWDCATHSAIATVIVCLAAALWIPLELSTSAVVIAIIFIAASQLFNFGLGVVTAKYESRTSRLLVYSLFGVPGWAVQIVAILAWSVHMPRSRLVVLTLAALMATAGAVLIRRGRNAWLQVELGKSG